MKKLRFLLALAVGVLNINTAQAQHVYTVPLAVGDTLNASVTSVSKVFSFSGNYNGAVITPIVTKISGTVAAQCVLYESIDGVAYSTTGDSLKSISATSRVDWHKVAPLNHYYTLTCTHTDTSGRAKIVVKYQPVKY